MNKKELIKKLIKVGKLEDQGKFIYTFDKRGVTQSFVDIDYTVTGSWKTLPDSYFKELNDLYNAQEGVIQ